MFGLVWVTNKIYARIRVTSAWRAPPAARSESEETLCNMYCWPKQSPTKRFHIRSRSWAFLTWRAAADRVFARCIATSYSIIYGFIILIHVWLIHVWLHTLLYVTSCVTPHMNSFTCDIILVHTWLDDTHSYVISYVRVPCPYSIWNPLTCDTLSHMKSHVWMSHEHTRMQIQHGTEVIRVIQ